MYRIPENAATIKPNHLLSEWSLLSVEQGKRWGEGSLHFIGDNGNEPSPPEEHDESDL